MDLDIAPDQTIRPVRVGGRLDAKGVRSPGLAAVVDLHGEWLRSRAGGPDNRCRACEPGMFASGRGRARSARAADKEAVKGLRHYPHVQRMIIVPEVPPRWA